MTAPATRVLWHCLITLAYQETFVNMMNQTAAALGMTNSHYKDCNGLPAPDHYSTPGDIAKLARAWILNFPDYYPWFKQKWNTYNKIRQPNRNRLLWRDPSVDGMKTGHTKAAGYCLVASAVRDGGMRLIAVVMHAPTDSARADDSEALLNYGFRFYETHKLYAGNTDLANPRTWFGKNNTTNLGLNKDLYVTIPKGQYKNIKAAMSFDGTIQAPVKQGDALGTIKVMLNDKKITEQPLIALKDNPKAGFLGRFIDHFELFFHKL